MSSLCFDTNILVDYLIGHPAAIALLDKCAYPVISRIVHMEVMVGCKHNPLVLAAASECHEQALEAVEKLTADWLNSTFKVLAIDTETTDFSVHIRKQTNAKLPDSVIHAHAILNGLDIVTRNTKDFKGVLKLPGAYKNVKTIVP